MRIKNVIAIIIVFSFLLAFASAQEAEATVCCEKTVSGLYCQDVPAAECVVGAQQIPTSCSSTSFCKGGTCYDSDEGICLDNTPQKVCNDNGGVWSATDNPACNLGCCVLGDQAAFVSLVRCKKLSAFLGLQTNYKSDIADEVECVLSVQGQDRGACVYESEFETTCKFTTRDDCKSGINGTEGNFNPNLLCSAEELKTNCGPTENTMCVPGKDEVYFVDSCGNPANVYDSSKLKDTAYWTNVIDKSEACNANSANANSASCGNCNYQLGSICRKAEKGKTQPSYGSNICADLNCKNTQNGNDYKHGESWCVFNDAGDTGVGKNSVGSRFFRHLCVNGEEVLEACADFRQEECIEDEITTSAGGFSQAACRVNRWQDCTAQTEQTDCENTDKRDCIWKPGAKLQSTTDNSTSKAKGACVPKNSPGLTFWEGEETQSICAQANAQCIVTFEKSLTGGEQCVKNCDCLTDSWTKQHNEICNALGDCGGNTNWAGDSGSKKGFKVTVTGVKSGESGGGLFG